MEEQAKYEETNTKEKEELKSQIELLTQNGERHSLLDHSKSVELVEGESRTLKGRKKSAKPTKKKTETSFKKNIHLNITGDISNKASPQHERVRKGIDSSYSDQRVLHLEALRRKRWEGSPRCDLTWETPYLRKNGLSCRIATQTSRAYFDAVPKEMMRAKI